MTPMSIGLLYAVADLHTLLPTFIRYCRPSYASHTLPIGTYLLLEVAPIDYDCFEIFKTVVADADFNTTRADLLECHTSVHVLLPTHPDRPGLLSRGRSWL